MYKQSNLFNGIDPQPREIHKTPIDPIGYGKNAQTKAGHHHHHYTYNQPYHLGMRPHKGEPQNHMYTPKDVHYAVKARCNGVHGKTDARLWNHTPGPSMARGSTQAKGSASGSSCKVVGCHPHWPPDPKRGPCAPQLAPRQH